MWMGSSTQKSLLVTFITGFWRDWFLDLLDFEQDWHIWYGWARLLNDLRPFLHRATLCGKLAAPHQLVLTDVWASPANRTLLKDWPPFSVNFPKDRIGPLCCCPAIAEFTERDISVVLNSFSPYSSFSHSCNLLTSLRMSTLFIGWRERVSLILIVL